MCVCVCVCVCSRHPSIHASIHTYNHTYMYRYIHTTYIHKSVQTYLHSCIFAHVCTCTFIHISLYLNIYINLRTNIYICAYEETFMHARTPLICSHTLHCYFYKYNLCGNLMLFCWEDKNQVTYTGETFCFLRLSMLELEICCHSFHSDLKAKITLNGRRLKS
jgi:hypothetical protein